MNFELIDSIIHWLGGLVAYTALTVIFIGIWRGTRREAGRTTGRMGTYLRSPVFYLITSLIYFAVCYLAWIPLPVELTPQVHLSLLIVGSLLFFPGMALILWARLTLGKNYFVSTGLGAQLFAGHQLVTAGPYAIVRHPMYLGIILAAWGSLPIYLTWTTLLFVMFSPALIVRARREEAALASEFGEQWQDYCLKVSAFIPSILNKTV